MSLSNCGKIVPVTDIKPVGSKLITSASQAPIGSPVADGIAFIPSEQSSGLLTQNADIWVTLHGDFVREADLRNRAIDANFLGGDLPTGDGIQGGLLESWFKLGNPQ